MSDERAFDEPFALEPMEGRVEGALLDEEHAFAALFDEPRDRVAVHWSAGECAENEEVEGALKEVERGHGWAFP